jgi:DNA-binding response OmpR family regulator
MSRILIVEDEELLADTLKDVLSSEGHEVRAVHNGRDALTVLERERPDVLLLDLMLPLVDGLDVLDAVGRLSPGTAVMVETSCAPDVLEGRRVHGFLRKPFSLDQLLNTLKAVLARSPSNTEGSSEAPRV